MLPSTYLMVLACFWAGQERVVVLLLPFVYGGESQSKGFAAHDHLTASELR
jgi:hypothetical protein